MNGQRAVYAAVSTGLTAWLVGTAANQLPDRRFDHLVTRGPLRFLRGPNWRFFGPNPGMSDVHLLYRDITGGTAAPWKEAEVTADRPWYGLAWNAGNRAPKVLFDTLQVIITAANASSGNMGRMVSSPGYRILQGYLATRIPHEPEADHTQFMLLQAHPEREGPHAVDPLFASEHIPLHHPQPAATP
ncbi:hypothetical protein C5F59_006275 [Streptomyces sp. QL37]|uniref:hypothetical protein n=1 Tax=Streptomyces sp. QL37 TaxID=2093747 RepID=UPI000CF1DB29|nr:hypothetical protein [Streptomyces sp. QL37]PPQ56338.1 hypothetical protein C5F59_06355 [Streptomyces sp. QL37]